MLLYTAEEGDTETLRQGLALFSALAKGERPFANRDRVRLYIQGAGQWRDYSVWPPGESRGTRYHLSQDGTLTIEPEPAEVAPSRYTYDPAHPTPSLHTPSPFKRSSHKPDMAELGVWSLHLTEISLAVAPGAHAVVLMDQAGWHMTGKLVAPANISIIALPAKCPELNPVENI